MEAATSRAMGSACRPRTKRWIKPRRTHRFDGMLGPAHASDESKTKTKQNPCKSAGLVSAHRPQRTPRTLTPSTSSRPPWGHRRDQIVRGRLARRQSAAPTIARLPRPSKRRGPERLDVPGDVTRSLTLVTAAGCRAQAAPAIESASISPTAKTLFRMSLLLPIPFMRRCLSLLADVRSTTPARRSWHPRARAGSCG